VQVHPDDAAAQRWPPWGKTECWYFAYTSRCEIGWVETGVTVSSCQAVEEKRAEDLLNFVNVHTGIWLCWRGHGAYAGAGSICGTQQQSDATTVCTTTGAA